MNKSIDELIGEIRGLAHKRLDKDQQERIINELRAHFDASVQARFELGPNHVGAEHEAVISFGDPVVFVDKMVAAHPPMRNSWMDRDASAALLAIMGLACSLLPLVSKLVLPISRQWQVFPWTLLLLLSCAAAICSWNARRPQIVALVANYFIGVAIWTLAATGADFPFRGPIPDIVARHFIAAVSISGIIAACIGAFSIMSWALARALERRKELGLA